MFFLKLIFAIIASKKMAKIFLIFISFVITTLSMTSCATLFTGVTDNIHFETKPYGAKVYIDEEEVCETTPCYAEVKRSVFHKKSAKIELDSYKTKVIPLKRRFNETSLINLHLLHYWAIDALTGSLIKYDKKNHFIELEKDKTAALNEITKNKLVTVDTTKTEKISERKYNELGLKIGPIAYLFGVNELVTLEYERILNKSSSIGISINVNVTGNPDGYEKIETPYEQDTFFFETPDKYDFVLQPYYRYFLSPDRTSGSGAFLEGNLYFGYYPYEIRNYHNGRQSFYHVVSDYTSLKDAINYGAGVGIGRKYVTKNGFVITALFGLGIRASTSMLNMHSRSGLTFSKQF